MFQTSDIMDIEVLKRNRERAELIPIRHGGIYLTPDGHPVVFGVWEYVPVFWNLDAYLSSNFEPSAAVRHDIPNPDKGTIIVGFPMNYETHFTLAPFGETFKLGDLKFTQQVISNYKNVDRLVASSDKLDAVQKRVLDMFSL